MMLNKSQNSFVKITFGDVVSVIGFFLLAILILLAHLYSYAPFEKADLSKIETTVTNIESHYSHPTSWITFTADDGLWYYVHTNDLKESKNDILDSLRERYIEENLTIYYTNRPELFLFSFMHFGNARRVAAIECGSDIIVSLDDFNQSTRGILCIAIVVAVILFVVSLVKAHNLFKNKCQLNQRTVP